MNFFILGLLRFLFLLFNRFLFLSLLLFLFLFLFIFLSANLFILIIFAIMRSVSFVFFSSLFSSFDSISDNFIFKYLTQPLVLIKFIATRVISALTRQLFLGILYLKYLSKLFLSASMRLSFLIFPSLSLLSICELIILLLLIIMPFSLCSEIIAFLGLRLRNCIFM